jgi:hypothetical protein
MRGLALLLGSLVGCAAPLADAPRPTNAVEVRLGGTARLGPLSGSGGANLSVRPLAVLEDSRCPRDVTCIWAGRLRLRVALVPGGEIELILGEPHALPAGAGTLTLVAAAPEPWQRPPAGVEAGAASRFAFRRD